jgi:phenylalanyl-tRNA synthetase alpha chain
MMTEIEIPELPSYSEESINEAAQYFYQILREEIEQINDASALEQCKVRWLGRKAGILKQISERWLPKCPPEFKRQLGTAFNALKQEIEIQLDPRKVIRTGIPPSVVEELRDIQRFDTQNLAAETIDITLPGTRRLTGAEHPITRTLNEITSVFAALGYSVGVGPEVETDFYNFECMNFPPGHPARDTQDTLVIANQERRPLRDRLLLRTHTSPVQMRTMERQPPPVRIVIPGKVHRNEADDATHSSTFHQVEGLCVDTNITFSDLKGTLDHAMKALFGSSVKTRFFPSFFPFTEPSADMQISCIFCGGKGCRKCKHSGWIELLGCGMVDPAVFAFAAEKQPGYDPKKISGFAFGMGAERIAMMKYGVSDIGQFYVGDMRFLGQFA